MASVVPSTAYRPPDPLQDLRVLDLLELTDSTEQAAELLHLSQATVSRRSRRIAHELGVELRKHAFSHGLRCGDGACLRLLRRAAKRHRLEAGVARIATDGWLAGSLERVQAVLPLPPRFRSIRQWHALVRGHVLDGAVVCGQELRLQLPVLPSAGHVGPEPFPWAGCLLTPLGSVTLQLVRARPQPHGRPGTPRWNGVLLPPIPCCPAITTLVRQRQRRTLHLRSGHNNPGAWVQSLRGNPVEALVSASWQAQLVANGLTVEPVPNAQPINVDVWFLVHRRDWGKQPELAQLVGRMREELRTSMVSRTSPAGPS